MFRDDKSYKFQNNHGQSVIELIVAMAVFGLIITSMATLAVGGNTALIQGGEQTKAETLAQEGIVAVRSIRDGAWNEIIYDQSGVEISSSEWIFSGEGTSEVIGQYTRIITFENVCRDALDEITICPGTYTDVHSKKVTVVVSWEVRPGITNSVQQIAYLTNWDSQEWVEDVLIDFDDGMFDNTETSATLGDGDGAVILGTE